MGFFNNDPLINSGDIRSLAKVLTLDHRLGATNQPFDSAPLLGNMYQHEVQPGLFLRINRIRDRVGLHSEAVLSPGLKVAVVWKGEARISFAHQPLLLGRKHGFQAMVAALDRPVAFQRQGIRGGIEHSAILTATPAWLRNRFDLDSPGRLLETSTERRALRFHSESFSIERWQPSTELIHRLEALDLSSTTTSLRLLTLEAIALDLVNAALVAADSPMTHGALPPHSWEQLMEHLINSGEAGRLSQSQLARRLGMSLRQLQRRYRQQFDAPLGEHLRHRRLQRAHDALCHGAISVESATAIAGYSSAANFATAFRKVYGVTPSACRRQWKDSQAMR